ncbi:hypothetical protein EYF80_065766 [Liparis tanakae]|uniref:Uncharacterized protein n=1 Tax=Liparis tanakae TaxID=230148 RepID=A0A4Z2E5R7_9TELE|nr:hypothetical protein EYF80_065766 [Liparis tanakae]
MSTNRILRWIQTAVACAMKPVDDAAAPQKEAGGTTGQKRDAGINMMNNNNNNINININININSNNNSTAPPCVCHGFLGRHGLLWCHGLLGALKVGKKNM